MKIVDQNGNRLSHNVLAIRKNGKIVCWRATVWFGGGYGCATDVNEYYYDTRCAARNADISDEIGKSGRIRSPFEH